MQTISLDGIWSVQRTALTLDGEAGLREAPAGGMAAAVPGEIHLDLLRTGQMADPEIGDNARREGRWPEEHAWWYRTAFTLDDVFVAHERQEIVFDGLDCTAQVFLNGQLIGAACNAFVGHRFDIRGFAQAGENTLIVRLTAGTELIADQPPTGSIAGDPIYAPRVFGIQRSLRKPQYQFGWDWNDPLPTVGIWRGVRLEGRSGVAIHELRLDTELVGEAVSLVGQVVLENLHPWTEREVTVVLEITPPDGAPIRAELTRTLPMGRTAHPLRIAIPDPQLWWPNGMGAQPLYALTARVLFDGAECDRTKQTLGLRTVVIDRALLPDGSRFCIRVNGEEVFCRGGNWAPPDMIPARVTPERWQVLVAEARNAHFTMFRVNGVGYYPDDAFFDACDRAGILLWQDFTFACMTYPDGDPAFRAAVAEEAETVVRRLRHHPSLALWCGCNESIWLNSGGQDPFTLGGRHLFGKILPDTCRRLDPVRPYWPCSPCGGEHPNCENSGNTHWWGPYMDQDLSKRQRLDIADECRARFVSEYGIIGPPVLESIRQYLPPEEQVVGSTSWRIHTNTFEIGSVAEGIRAHYRDPEGLALKDYLHYGQLYQAQAHGHAMEAMRFRKGDPDAECWGALIWSYNDCWGEMGWSVIDHYLRRKISYYWLRRACKPMKILVRPRGETLVTRIVNDTRLAYDAWVHYGWFRLDGADRRLEERQVRIPANGMLEITRATTPPDLEPCEWLYAAVLRGPELPDDQALWLPAPIRALSLPAPQVEITPWEDGWSAVSPVFCHAVQLDDDAGDNYIDLLPGVAQRIGSERSRIIRDRPFPDGIASLPG